VRHFDHQGFDSPLNALAHQHMASPMSDVSERLRELRAVQNAGRSPLSGPKGHSASGLGDRRAGEEDRSSRRREAVRNVAPSPLPAYSPSAVGSHSPIDGWDREPGTLRGSGAMRSESRGSGWSVPPSPPPLVRAGPPQQSRSPHPQPHEPARSIHGAINAVFEHEDAVRQAMKARLQQLGEVVNLSAQVLAEGESGTKLAEGCRSLTNEAASLCKQIAQRQTELAAELQNCRRSRLVYGGAPGHLPPERHGALTNEIDMLRDEVKSLKLRERQLLSQVKMLSGDAVSRATASPGSVPQSEVASEMMRLNEEVTSLRSEREVWRTRALAAEAKLLVFPEVPPADARNGAIGHKAAAGNGLLLHASDSDAGPGIGIGGRGAWFEPTTKRRVSEGKGGKELQAPGGGGREDERAGGEAVGMDGLERRRGRRPVEAEGGHETSLSHAADASYARYPV